MLLDKVTDSSNSVVQERYITLSVHKKMWEEACAFFDRTVHDASSRLNHGLPLRGTGCGRPPTSCMISTVRGKGVPL